MKYKVYTKETEDKEPLDLEFAGFEIDGSLLRPRDRGNEASAWGFLNLESIAAVIPEPSEEELKKAESPFFKLYLKGRKEPLDIYAQAIEFSQKELQFCWVQVDLGAVERIKKHPMKNIYVAISEVVAVVYCKGFSPSNVF